jgi:hypothetical protein
MEKVNDWTYNAEYGTTCRVYHTARNIASESLAVTICIQMDAGVATSNPAHYREIYVHYSSPSNILYRATVI